MRFPGEPRGKDQGQVPVHSLGAGASSPALPANYEAFGETLLGPLEPTCPHQAGDRRRWFADMLWAMPVIRARRPTLRALQLLESIAQCFPFLGPPADPDLRHALALLDRQHGDAERCQGVHLREDRLDDRRVQLPKGPVAAGRHAEKITKLVKRPWPADAWPLAGSSTAIAGLDQRQVREWIRSRTLYGEPNIFPPGPRARAHSPAATTGAGLQFHLQHSKERGRRGSAFGTVAPEVGLWTILVLGVRRRLAPRSLERARRRGSGRLG